MVQVVVVVQALEIPDLASDHHDSFRYLVEDPDSHNYRTTERTNYQVPTAVVVVLEHNSASGS